MLFGAVTGNVGRPCLAVVIDGATPCSFCMLPVTDAPSPQLLLLGAHLFVAVHNVKGLPAQVVPLGKWLSRAAWSRESS